MRSDINLLLLGLALFSTLSAAEQLKPDDFVYRGAFAIDGGTESTPGWNAYGQRGMGFDPSGDPGNTDAFPGSLWVTGHDYERWVVELSIPDPSIETRTFGELPRPTLLTVPTQFTSGCDGGSDWLAGVEVHGNLLWGSCAQWYNVTGEDLSAILWRRSLGDLSNLQGPFHAGPVGKAEFHSNRQGMYILSIPTDWATAHLGGRTLATGMHRGAHGGQQGPTILAFDPTDPTDGFPLLYYRQREPCYDDKSQCDFPDYTACDYWSSATWVSTPEDDSVLISGKKFDGSSDYVPGGWACGPGFGTILFYDADDLASRSARRVKPWKIVPYAAWRPDQLWDGQNELGGISFDSTNGYLYVVEKYAGPDGTAIVHVFQLEMNSKSPDPPLAPVD